MAVADDRPVDISGLIQEMWRGGAMHFVIHVAARLAGLGAMAVYVRSLSSDQVGLQAIALLNEQVLITCAGSAVTSAFVKHYSEASEAADKLRVVGTALRGLVITGVPVAIAWQVVAPAIAGLTLGGSPSAVIVIRLVGLSLVPNLVIMLAQSIWVLDIKVMPFALTTIGQYTLAALAGIGLVGLGYGGIAPVAGWVLGTWVVAIYTAWSLLRLGRLSYDRNELLAMWRYGWPLVPAALLMLGLTVNDRYILARIAGLGDTGVYALVVTVAVSLNTAVTVPLKRMWWALAWRSRDSPQEATFHRWALSSYVRLQAAIALALLVFGDVLMRVLSDGQQAYVDAAPAIAIVYVGFALLGASDILTSGYFFSGRTSYYPRTVAASFAVSVVFNILAIPAWGLWAAAVSNPVCYLVFSWLSWHHGAKFLRIDHDRHRILLTTGLAAAIGAAAAFGSSLGAWWYAIGPAGLAGFVAHVVVAQRRDSRRARGDHGFTPRRR